MAEYRNAIRSKKLIRTSFASLIKEKGDISKITVKEIVSRAGISKSTFYCHYQDIYAIIEEFDQELFVLLETTLTSFNKNKQGDFTPFIEKVITTLSENESLYRCLITTDTSNYFINKLKNKCVDTLMSGFKNNLTPDEYNNKLIEISFIINGILYSIIDYFKNNINSSLSELADKINYLLIKITE